MKNLFYFLLGLVTLNFFLVQCKKENSSKKNSITYQNQKYPIDKGVLEYYGIIHGTGNNMDLTLLSSGLVVHETNNLIDSISGVGNGINFELFTSGTTALDGRNFTFSSDNNGNVGTFDYGNVILNYNIATNQGINQNITNGIVSITSVGTTYEISFNGTLKNGEEITGYYKGSLKYYNNTQRMALTKSARVKNYWWKRTIQ